MWSWGWWQREDTMAQRLHLKVHKGVKQGEKTGNYRGKCVGSLGRMVHQEVWDLVVGACWEMSAGSRLEQTPQEWFCWDKCSDFALTLGNPGSSMSWGWMRSSSKNCQRRGKGKSLSPVQNQQAAFSCWKEGDRLCTCLGKSGHCPCLAHQSSQTEPWAQQISGPSHTGSHAGVAAVSKDSHVPCFTHIFNIDVYLLNWNKIFKVLKDGWLPLVFSSSVFHSCSCCKFKECIPGHRFLWHLWIKWRLKSVKRMFNSCI